MNDETFPSSGEQITSTYYDGVFPYSTPGLQSQFDEGGQQNLRSRISTVTYSAAGTPATYDNAIHYSYDIHGNVNNLIQENTDLTFIGQQYKKIRYDYDVVSDKTNIVDYQPNQVDQFIHKYEYDADNRVTNVYTSADSVIWDQDVKYFYYLYGPLGREEIGQDKVHGCDYAYTIDGLIKGVNSNLAVEQTDIGTDGSSATDGTYWPAVTGYTVAHPGIHSNIATDCYGYTLGYFNGDYSAINSALNNYIAPSGGMINSTSFWNNGQTMSVQGDFPNMNTIPCKLVKRRAIWMKFLNSWQISSPQK